MLLLDWARIYHTIFDLPSTDRPPIETIEEDGKLDKWFEEQHNEAEAIRIKHQRQRRKSIAESDYMQGMPQ